MNFLQLCRALVREADMNGSGPQSVVGQTGEYGRVVEWINNAYMDIQLKHDDWSFMWASFSKTLTSGVGDYSATEMTHDVPANRVNVARFDCESFRCFRQSEGVNAERYCWFVPYQTFRDTYRFGPARAQEGFPTFFTVGHDKSVMFHPKPNDVYVVTGEFYRAAAAMAANDDVPVLPTEFHYVIVWWALTKYAGFEESTPVYQHGLAQLNRMMAKMERQERPSLAFCEPLV